MAYSATKHPVSNRGVPPDSFLDELIAWGVSAADEIFAANAARDVYSGVEARGVCAHLHGCVKDAVAEFEQLLNS